MPVKVKKLKQKQKQKQRQHQSVVVNVHTTRRAPRKSKTPAKGLGTNFVSYPVYTNAHSDYAPIINNLPAQYQNQPAISLPVQALLNTSTPNYTSHPLTPNQLQTVGHESNPLTSLVRKPHPIMSSALIDELKAVQRDRPVSRLGEDIIGSNIPRFSVFTPFQEELKNHLIFDDESMKSISRLSSPAFIQSPDSAFSGINPMKKPRRVELKGLGEEQLKARKAHYDAERRKNKKI